MTHTPTNSNNSGQRWWLWLPLLGLSAWLAIFGDKSPAGDAQALSLPTRETKGPTSPVPAPPSAARAGAAVPVDMLEPLVERSRLMGTAPDPEPGASLRRDLFATRSWAPPPLAAAPAAPVAPPFPYVFVGKKFEGDDWEVYLGRGEQSHIVREGQVLEGGYRIDRIAPPTMTLTYLPMGQAQSLMIGDSR